MTNDFIGSGIEGLDDAPVVKASAVETKPSTRYQVPSHRTDKPQGAPTSVVEKARQETLNAFYDRPLADANAEVIGRDDWGRKVELHAAGWDAKAGLQPRRFKDGAVVYIMHGFMEHTFSWGTVRDHDIPSYVQQNNSAEVLASAIAAVEAHGIITAPSTKKNIPRGIKAKVVDRGEGTTVSVGLCHAYECEVIDGPLKGLRTLELPSQIVDKNGIDADGIPHPDVLAKVRELEAKAQ